MANEPDVHVVDNPAAKRFEGYLGDDLVGVVEYIPLQGKVIATHTEVGEAFEGRGIGSRLVAGVLGQLRSEGRSVQPLCPYVAAFLPASGVGRRRRPGDAALGRRCGAPAEHRQKGPSHEWARATTRSHL